MLIELALRGRLQLEPCGVRRRGLLSRKVKLLGLHWVEEMGMELLIFSFAVKRMHIVLTIIYI